MNSEEIRIGKEEYVIYFIMDLLPLQQLAKLTVESPLESSRNSSPVPLEYESNSPQCQKTSNAAFCFLNKSVCAHARPPACCSAHDERYVWFRLTLQRIYAWSRDFGFGRLM